MLRDAPPDALEVPPAEPVALALARIERSTAFRSSRRHRALLRHLLERLLAGDTASLKESVLAVEVFGRRADRFDPRSDTIVRVETRRLRQRLDAYFRGEGRDLPWRIELPVGSYVPRFFPRPAAADLPAATRRARDLVERGEAFLRQPLSQATLEQARERFEAALAESPDHVPALVGLGRAWLNLATGWYHPPAVAGDHAAESLRRALALEPGHATAHVLLGAIEHGFERDWTRARRSFQRALALAPQEAFVHSAYGCHLLMHGDFALAETELLLARRLDPQYVNTRMHLVNLRLAQQRPDDAGAELEGLRDLAPQSLAATGLAGLLALLRGDTAAALAHYHRVLELAPDHAGAWAALAGALGAAGRAEESDARLAEAETRFGAEAISPYVRAVIAARCGRADLAFGMIGQALERRDPLVVQLAQDPSFAGLHADPRWPAAVAAAARP